MTITIIGAGISGLVLSRCLLHRGIPSLILEKTGQAAFTHKRNNYGITLHRKTYQPLLKFLGVDEERFTREVGIGGVGVGGELLRVNRRLFEGFLSEGLDVRWEGEGESLDGDGKAGGQGVLVKLRGGEEIQSEVVVGADGPHSLVREKISPETQFDILPFVAINGRRRLAPAELQEAGMANESIVEQRVGDALFRVSLDERMEREGEVGISWTFSRPARRGEDALFRPQRAKKAAKEIPEELFGEVEGMNGQLRGVLKVVFDTEKMRGDRMLNWLMRTVEVDSGRLNDAAKVCMIRIERLSSANIR